MKFVLVVVVVVVVLWLMFGRGRSAGRGAAAARRADGAAAAPAAIVCCSHCGLHLPQPDAVPAAGGRFYCSEAHRLAGPGPTSGGAG